MSTSRKNDTHTAPPPSQEPRLGGHADFVIPGAHESTRCYVAFSYFGPLKDVFPLIVVPKHKSYTQAFDVKQLIAYGVIILMQVLATQCLDAPHGKVRDAWEAIATVLSTLSTFQVYGGVKWDGCRRRYLDVMAQFRKDVANGEFKSGARTGDNEDLHRALVDLMAVEDEKKEDKEATTAAKVGRETDQARRADMVRAILFLSLVLVHEVYSGCRSLREGCVTRLARLLPLIRWVARLKRGILLKCTAVMHCYTKATPQ